MANEQQPISHNSDSSKELEVKSILDNIDRGFMVVDGTWCIIYVNAKAAFDVGRDANELIGKNIWAEFPDLEGTNVAKMYRKAMDERVAVEIEEYSVITGRWSQQKSFPSASGIVIAWADFTERKKVQETLEQTKNRLQDILNGIVDGITLVGLDGKIVDCNQASMRLLNLTYDELIGTNVYDTIIDEDKQQAINGAYEVLKTGKVVNEVRVKRRNHPYFWAEISVTALCDKNGKPNLFLGVTRDITERKKLETTLKLSEEKFSKAFLNSPFAVTLTCLSDGKIVEVNDSAASLFGYNRQEVIGRTTLELHMWAKPEERQEFTQMLTSSGVVYNKELSLRKRDGSIFFVLISASLIEFQGEKHFLSTFLDITERKKAEEDLARSKQRITDILSSIDEYVFSLDKNWNIIYVSNKAATIAGFKPQELVGTCFWDYGRIFIGTLVEESFHKAMDKREIITFEWKSQLTSGFIAFTIFPSNEGITIYGEDITERKKLETQLENYSKNLEKTVEERTKQLQEKERLATIGQTAGMVGHDIRNPLQAMTGDLYLIKTEINSESTDKQAVIESVEAIEENIAYVNKIVSDLQNYTRPIAPNKKDTLLDVLIETAMANVRVPKDIRTEIMVESGIRIYTDQDYFRRILTNLILNAIQAMPNGGTLRIQANNHESKTIILVEDTGVGIPDDVKDRLFTPLFTTKSKGQGLGLAVVKRLVEGLNGNISVESEEGKGTKFLIEIPTA